jgi:hypothetical protein
MLMMLFVDIIKYMSDVIAIAFFSFGFTYGYLAKLCLSRIIFKSGDWVEKIKIRGVFKT